MRKRARGNREREGRRREEIALKRRDRVPRALFHYFYDGFLIFILI